MPIKTTFRESPSYVYPLRWLRNGTATGRALPKGVRNLMTQADERRWTHEEEIKIQIALHGTCYGVRANMRIAKFG